MVGDNAKNISFEEESGYVFAIIEDYLLLDLEELKNADGVLIISHTQAMTGHMVTRIRTSREMEVYLIPLFIVGNPDSLPIAISQVIDGSVTSTGELYRLTEEVKRIKQNMKNFG